MGRQFPCILMLHSKEHIVILWNLRRLILIGRLFHMPLPRPILIRSLHPNRVQYRRILSRLQVLNTEQLHLLQRLQYQLQPLILPMTKIVLNLLEHIIHIGQDDVIIHHIVITEPLVPLEHLWGQVIHPDIVDLLHLLLLVDGLDV